MNMENKTIIYICRPGFPSEKLIEGIDYIIEGITVTFLNDKYKGGDSLEYGQSL